MKQMPLFVVFALVACDTKDAGVEESRVAALEAQVADLQSQLAAVRSRLDAHDTTLADASTTLVAAEDLFAVMRVDSNGDVVITNANLLVQNGSGSTYGAPNEKGNIKIGYDEDDTEGTCNGGPLDGQPCENSGVCGVGTCDNIHTVSEKTGSHYLVVGPGHTYKASSGLVAGATNRLLVDSVSIVGGVGQTADTYGQVLP